MSREEYHRKPNREVTTSVEEYARAWRDFAKPIEDATGLEAVGFDPFIEFFDPQSRRIVGRLESSMIEKINAALAKRNA